MKQMMDMSKLNENHKLLADMNGSWNYTIKMWMNPDPNAKPQESKGTATRKSVMGGRYVMMDVTGKMQMPGEDGKMKDMQFKGMGIEGYDNAEWVLVDYGDYLVHIFSDKAREYYDLERLWRDAKNVPVPEAT